MSSGILSARRIKLQNLVNKVPGAMLVGIMPDMHKSRLIAGSGVLAAVLFWAGNAVLARAVKDSIPPVSLNFWRWFIVAVILLPWFYRGLTQYRAEIFAAWKVLVLQSLLSVTLFNTCLYLAAHTTAAANISLINAMVPVLVFVFSWLLLGLKPRRNQVIGLLIAIAGLLIVVSRGRLNHLLGIEFVTGDYWMLVAILSWSLYSVLLKKLPLRLPPLVFLACTAVIGDLLLLPFYLLEFNRLGGMTLSTGHFSVLLYVALLASIAAYYFWGRGVGELGPNATAMFGYLLPVFTAVFGLLFLSEPISTYQLAGGLMIFLGFYLGTSGSGSKT